MTMVRQWSNIGQKRQPGLVPDGPLPNLKEALDGITRKMHHMGAANQQTYYCKEWKAARHTMRPVSYEYKAKHGLVSWGESRNADKCRTGTLHTSRRAKQFGYSDTGLCPAGCGQADSIGHLTSGWPLIERPRTERHNAAAGIIGSGRRHNSIGTALHSADIGKSERCRQASVEHNCPVHVYPALLPEDLEDRQKTALLKQKLI